VPNIFFFQLFLWHADIFSRKESRTEYEQTLSRRHFKCAPSNSIHVLELKKTVVEDNLQVNRN